MTGILTLIAIIAAFSYLALRDWAANGDILGHFLIGFLMYWSFFVPVPTVGEVRETQRAPTDENEGLGRANAFIEKLKVFDAEVEVFKASQARLQALEDELKAMADEVGDGEGETEWTMDFLRLVE